MHNDSDPRVRRRGAHALLITILFFIAVGLILWAIDAAIAARAEHRISQAVRNNAQLDQNPSVYVGGVPYTATLITGKIPELSVNVSDVEVADFGLLVAGTSVTDLKLSRSEVLSGSVDGAKAQLVSRDVGFDAVAVGKQLGIDDLDLSNPYDISPAGTNASEVQLRGTPHGFHSPVTVQADLRLKGEDFYLTPITVMDRGDNTASDADILAAFDWTLNTRTLPINAQASYVYFSGGTIRFEAQERNVTLRLEDLSPLRSTNNKVVVE